MAFQIHRTVIVITITIMALLVQDFRRVYGLLPAVAQHVRQAAPGESIHMGALVLQAGLQQGEWPPASSRAACEAGRPRQGCQCGCPRWASDNGRHLARNLWKDDGMHRGAVQGVQAPLG